MFKLRSVSNVGFSFLFLFSLIALTFSLTNAQVSLNGATPSGLAPGAPAGSYSLSGFESVNAYNGNLNFNLPIVSIGGRGSAATNLSLQIDQKWSVRREEDPQYGTITNFPDDTGWLNSPTYLGANMNSRTAGNLQVTCVSQIFGDRKVYAKALTRLTVKTGDGTEYELRDSLTGGEPKNVPRNGFNCPITNMQTNRGRVFVTADGTSATFIADYDVIDEPFVDPGYVYEPSGILMLKDGSRWRFNDGLVSWIRDRNGNKLTFSYTGGKEPVITVTDSLNRQVSIQAYVTDSTYGYGNRVTYKGFGGTSRTVFITLTSMTNVLRSDQTLKTYYQLFPTLNGSSPYTAFNPTVVGAVHLPNGKTYQFKYNSFGELARVVLPTGGAIEYDWDVGDASTTYEGGVISTQTVANDYGVYRRVMERRVYADGSTLEHKMTYSRPTEINGSAETSVVIETLDASNNLLGKQKSYFYGSARKSFEQLPLSYSKWQETREYKTESFDFNGSTILRRSESTFAQRAAVSWWTGASSDAPPNDPRTTESLQTLVDTNQVSKQTFDYDQFNNQTDVYEYDFGSGSAGSFVRRTHTDFVTTNPVNSGDYASASPTTSSIHIRNLPSETWVSSDTEGSTKKSKTTFEYDNYASDSNHAGLINRSSISGHDSSYTTSYGTRGNATAVSRWLLPSTTLTSYQQYDIAGNVVLIKDPRGYSTTATYGDSFGSPDGNATTNTSPSELSGVSQTSYAFATIVTNSLSQATKSQFDFYTGMPVDGEDINGVVSSGYSTNESLDRPTKIIRAVGESVENQTLFEYDDTNRIVTTKSDLVNSGDAVLKTESYYDGLGRTFETRRYEGSTAYIKTTQTFDALGRIKRTYNPHRTSSASTDGYAESTYDALGRVTAVTTSDGAVVGTSYSGNTVTVTDQANKSRKSVTDGVGRLTTVYEPDSGGTLNVNTDYTYDVLGNLLNVYQGSQTRTFAYDSLSRLTTATNRESGAITYTYDNNGNLYTKTDALSRVTTYTYDAINRVSNRDYSDSTPDVTYTYDNVTNGIGRLTKVSNSNSETHYTAFDKLGRVTGHKQRLNSTDYTTANTYNRAGMLLEETYPSGRVVKNTIGSYGDMTQVETKPSGGNFATRASNFVYTAPGAVGSMQLGNGKYETTAFNSRLQPTQIGLGTSTADTSLLKLEYGYGTTANNGNVLSQTITVPGVTYSFNQTYAYDTLNRIATATETYNGSQTWSQTYGYDRYGNRNITAGNGATSLSFDATSNKITTSGYVYDSVGNTTADPSGKTYTYDAENKQLTVANSGGNLGTYYYDGDGKRVKKTSASDNTTFIYDAAGKLIEERVSSTGKISVAYVYAGGRLLTTELKSDTNYLTADHLGSPRINTDSGGSVVARHDYMPFGEELTPAITSQRTTGVGYAADTIRKQFTTYERDAETKLDFAQARMYGNSHGRFTSPDPTLLSVNAYNPQSWNRYIYVLNNPYLYTDPLGLWEVYYQDRTKTKKNKDGTETQVFDRREVFARKTKDGDNGASLAKQLGLTGKDAKKFAEKIGSGDNIQLSKQGGDVGRVFGAVESGLTEQKKFEDKNPGKPGEGPRSADCSETACKIAYPQQLFAVLTFSVQEADQTITANNSKSVQESDLRIADIVRFAKNGDPTHFATFIFRNDSGQPEVFSKSGARGPFERATTDDSRWSRYGYGTITGINKGDTGYYRP